MNNTHNRKENIVVSIKFTKDILENWEGLIGIADRNDNILIIRTKSSAWRALAGREWHYDRSTGLLKINCMN